MENLDTLEPEENFEGTQEPEVNTENLQEPEGNQEETQEPEGTSEETQKEPKEPKEKPSLKFELAGEEVEVPGLTDELVQELSKLAQKEELEESDFKKLEEKGYSRALISLAFKGYKSAIEEQAQNLFKEVGGEEKYKEMARWASKNLSDEEKEEWNSIMGSGNLKAMKWAMRGLQALYTSQTQKPRTLTGTSSGKSIKPFESKAEWFAAMDDPRYGKDPEYMKEFDERLKRTNIKL